MFYKRVYQILLVGFKAAIKMNLQQLVYFIILKKQVVH